MIFDLLRQLQMLRSTAMTKGQQLTCCKRVSWPIFDLFVLAMYPQATLQNKPTHCRSMRPAGRNLIPSRKGSPSHKSNWPCFLAQVQLLDSHLSRTFKTWAICLQFIVKICYWLPSAGLSSWISTGKIDTQYPCPHSSEVFISFDYNSFNPSREFLFTSNTQFQQSPMCSLCKEPD